MANFLITTQETRHILDNFRRDRTTFSILSAADRSFTRYNEKLMHTGAALGFYRSIYNDFAAAQGYSIDSLWPQVVAAGMALGGCTLKVSIIAGAVITGPLWLYQVWGFVTPGLKKNERRYTVVFIGASSALFVTGMTLAYLVLSKGLNVLINAAGSGTIAVLTANGYLSFVALLLVRLRAEILSRERTASWIREAVAS